MLLAKKYYDKDRFEEAWYDSSMVYYSKMEESETENKGDLTIVFKSGGTYKYKDVSLSDYVLLVAGGTDASNGKTLNKIIKGQYKYEKLQNANMQELNERYQAVLDEKDRDVNTYFVSGPEDITEVEFEANYEGELDNINSMDCYFIVGDGDGVDIMTQNFLLDVLNINPENITVYCVGDKPRNINNKVTRVRSGFKDMNDMCEEMTKRSRFDVAYVREGDFESQTVKNILRRHILVKL